MNLSDKYIITNKKFTTCSTQKTKQIYFLKINYRKREVPLICFSFSAVGLQEKVNYDILSVEFSVKIYHVVPDSVSFWDAEKSKSQSLGLLYS